MADLTGRIAAAPLRRDGDDWAGDCLAQSCRGVRFAEAWGTADGTTVQVATTCGKCGRFELEPAPEMEQDRLPGMEQDRLPGMEDDDG